MTNYPLADLLNLNPRWSADDRRKVEGVASVASDRRLAGTSSLPYVSLWLTDGASGKLRAYAWVNLDWIDFRASERQPRHSARVRLSTFLDH